MEKRTPRGRLARPAVAVGGALAVGAVTATGPGRGLDRRLYRTINRAGGSIPDAFFTSITEFGSIWASAGAALVLARRGWRRTASDAMGSALTMWAAGQLLKKIYRRPRPYRALEDVRLMIREPNGTSWPSSHPAVLLAFLQIAANDLGLSRPARSALAALVASVGVSRVYLGVHYPSDVIGGLLLGWGVAEAWSLLPSSSRAGADG